MLCATHKTRREVEEQIAALRPLPPAPSLVRRLPQQTMPVPGEIVARPDPEKAGLGCIANEPASIPMRSTPRPVVTPLAPEHYRVQFTVNHDTREKLRKIQDLMRHIVPNGDLATIFDRALTVLLGDLERRKIASVERPRRSTVAKTTGRHVPSRVKRAVWARDQGQCAFVGTKGRCGERGFLEFHHVIPFADGGKRPWRIYSCVVALTMTTKRDGTLTFCCESGLSEDSAKALKRSKLLAP